MVHDIRFVPAKPEMRETGLRGWVNFTLEGFAVDGVEVRRKLEGGHRLKFPVHVDRTGVEHPIIRPLNQVVRTEIERQIFDHLRKGAWVL